MSNKIDFTKGTVAIRAKVEHSADPNVTMFNFFEYKTNEGEISLKLKNRTSLVFTHSYRGRINNLSYDFSEYFDKDIVVVVTWSIEDEELILYINGDLKKKAKIS